MPNTQLSINPELVDTAAEKLLVEWFEQWRDRDDMPVKMGDALHVRTATYFVQKQANDAVEQAVMLPRLHLSSLED